MPKYEAMWPSATRCSRCGLRCIGVALFGRAKLLGNELLLGLLPNALDQYAPPVGQVYVGAVQVA
jgi:hypothetical protein